MNPWQEELAIREEIFRRDALIRGLFGKQERVYRDTARKIALLTPRRGGKTTCLLSIALRRAWARPGITYNYIAKTYKSAQYITWPVLHKLKRDLGLPLEMRRGDLEGVLPNGSRVRLFGADREDLQDRMFGAGVEVGDIFIDEAAVWKTSLRRFVNEVLWPTLLDRGGRLYMASMPSEILAGFFFDVTRPDLEHREPGWSVHTWQTSDNPAMAAQFAQMCEEFERDYGPEYRKLPWFRRQWLGEWVSDVEGNVYEFDRFRNTVDGWPLCWEKYNEPCERFVLSMDTGWSGGMAFGVGSYCPVHYREWVLRESIWIPRLYTDEIAAKVNDYRDRYSRGPLTIIGDPNNAQLLNDLNARFHVPVAIADKLDKKDWIRIENSEFAKKRILVIDKDGCNDDAIRELVSLKRRYFPDGTWEEDLRTSSNHCADMQLYAFRNSYPYLYKEPAKRPKPGTPEYDAEQEAKMRTAAFKRAQDLAKGRAGRSHGRARS